MKWKLTTIACLLFRVQTWYENRGTNVSHSEIYSDCYLNIQNGFTLSSEWQRYHTYHLLLTIYEFSDTI